MGSKTFRWHHPHPETVMDKSYVDTVRLLLEVVPDVFQAGCFAMKGGTALNLFVQDMPRLSVDIDVVYVAHDKGREAALAEIGSELNACTGDCEAVVSMHK